MLKPTFIIKFLTVFCFILCTNYATYGQKQKKIISINKNQCIAKVENNQVWIEPVIAADPSNPKFLIAASFKSNINDYRKPRKTIGVFKSINGGNSWETKELGCTDCTNPWITITNKGIIFLTVMGRNPNKLKSHLFNILVFTSLDNGNTWSESPQVIEGKFDGPKTIAAEDGVLYLTAQTNERNSDNIYRDAIFIGRAEPGKLKINSIQNFIPSNLALSVDMPAVLSDGSLYVSYFDYQHKADGGFKTRKGRLKKRRAWAIKSKDNGKTFSEDLFITEDAAFRPNSFISANNSNEFRDRLFFASMDENLRDIIFAYSTDNGDEWIQTKVEATAKKDRSRFYPQIAINKNGILALAWMDFRDSANQNCYAPYVSISKDGGKTFPPPKKIASEMSCPDTKTLNPAKRWNVGGDYFGLTTTADGKFHILWPDARSGFFELWYTSFDVSSPQEN